MLITFRTDAYANITMLGDVALTMIRMMGHSDVVPGAILAADIPEALNNLKRALDEQPIPADTDDELSEGQEDEDQKVSLANHAYPLLELLAAAAKDECDLMWDKA
ncbi:hypothetical protein ADIMK_3589 [Marinobacterium lacunae]|uniref:DUF1840 domain-containing protein n=1 Tax=Marinobacterium lacunae TaxID=1232683 RepID=A0A081FUU4_9GAMM|nr:DUF1840 domain-containing protein [Marinobacterium lacunae]KEA62299.1 hypothetical protein ADIMK_3589 [Marinobacterium lacunae]MBR9883587.1 DUF1840 domain-containing protein [Oceanospirillales bacterium]